MPKKALTIKELTDEWKRLQRQKYDKVGNIEARVLENICHAQGEIDAFVRGGILRTDPATDNLVNLNLNLIGPLKRKLKGRLLAVSPAFDATPSKMDPVSIDLAEVASDLIRAGDRKVNQHAVQDEILDWLLDGGMAIEHIPWVENVSVEPMPVRDPEGGPDAFMFTDLTTGEQVSNATAQELVQGQIDPITQQVIVPPRAPETFELYREMQEVGDFVSEVHGPLSVFIDQTTHDLETLSPDHCVEFASIRTVAWAKKTYKDSAGEAGFDLDKLKSDEEMRIIRTNLNQVGDSRSGINIKRLIPRLQGSPSDDDPDMVVVIHRYQPVSEANPDGRETVFVPGQGILLDQDLPYEDGIPAVAYHWGPVTTNFYTRDWVHDLIPANLAYAKGMSAMREYANAFIKAEKLLGGDLTQEDIAPTDVARAVEGGLGPAGEHLIAFAAPPQVPGWYMQHLEMLKQDLHDIAGGADLFRESKFPGQLRGSMGFPALQEILDTEWGPFFLRFGTQLAKAKQMRLNRMKQFYQGVRLIQYTSKTQQEETMEFKASEVLRANVDFNVTVDVNSLIPELRAMREERVANRRRNFPELYTDKRTGQADDGKMARDLQIGDKQRLERTAQYRKLATQIIKRLRKGQPAPQVAPFWDFPAMMDEVEAEMATMEFIEQTSPQTQQAFSEFWGQMQQMAQQQAEQMAQAQQSQEMEGIIAQTSQQAAAQAANAAVQMAVEQWQESMRQQAASGVDLNQMFGQATEQ